MACGTGTSADAMIRLAHARNAVEGFDGYKPLPTEAAIGFASDAVLLPENAVASVGGGQAALEVVGLGSTPAGRKRRVIVMDGLKLLGFGPRTLQAVAELARSLHPEVSLRLLI